MRTRLYDASTIVRQTTPIRAVGTDGGSKVDYTIDVNTSVRHRNEGFFIDEPNRSWTLPFGEASRWEEQDIPAPGGDVLDGGYDNIAGHPPSNIVYQNSLLPWYVKGTERYLFTHTHLDELAVAWPFRLRDRVSLNNAIQKQRRKLTSSNGDLAETLGELPECRQLFKLVSRYRGIKANASGLYLGYRFGWKPTVDAFVASCQELRLWLNKIDEIHKRRDGTLTLVHRGSDDWSLAKVNRQKVLGYASPYVDPGNRGLVVTNYYDPVLEKHEGTITYMARINSKGRYTDGWDTMSRLARIGGIPSLETLWALLPSSFLVDWFVSVGDMISYFQGNLLYDQELLCEAWSWSLNDTMTLHYQGRDRKTLWRQQVRAFYRSRAFPLSVPWFPRLGLVSNRVLPTLAVLLASRLPGDTASVRTIYRTLKRLGYAW